MSSSTLGFTPNKDVWDKYKKGKENYRSKGICRNFYALVSYTLDGSLLDIYTNKSELPREWRERKVFVRLLAASNPSKPTQRITVDLIWRRRLNRYDPVRKSLIRDLPRSRYERPLCAYDKEGMYIGEYKNVDEAMLNLYLTEKDKLHVLNVCEGFIILYKDMQFRYSDKLKVKKRGVCKIGGYKGAGKRRL